MGNDTVLSTAAPRPQHTRHTVTGDLDVAAVHRLRSGFAATIDGSDLARPGVHEGHPAQVELDARPPCA